MGDREKILTGTPVRRRLTVDTAASSGQRRINRLSPGLANQIAAGEVIERPAAALKELIENALDAEARTVKISIEDGGVTLMEIQDDGAGIIADDLPLAFERHATSKIRDQEDLAAIASLGFRGEALASLAAVSDLTLASRPRAEDNGWEYAIGREKPLPKSMAPGTIVRARDLFANIPARRRFLRSAATEAAHCLTVVRQATLSQPAVAFSLTTNGREKLRLAKAENLSERLSGLFPELADNLIEVNESAGGMTLSGHIFSPSLVDGGKRIGQYFYINGRIVRDPMLRRAVSDSLREITHHGEPGYVLFLKTPLQGVDVNVHPSKLEVRFAEPRLIFDFIRRALNKSIARPLGVPIRELPVAAPPQLHENTASFDSRRPPLPRPYSPAAGSVNPPPAWRQDFAASSPSPLTGPPPTNLPPLTETGPLVGDQPLGRALGQVHRIYIVAENNRGLIVVDMHAAHERLLYEELRTDEGAAPMQTLLAPIDVPLSAQQAATLAEQADSVLGLVARLADENTAEITAVDSRISRTVDPGLLLSEVLDDLAHDGAGMQAAHRRDLILSRIACHAAVRANDTLSTDEMNRLLRKMEKVERSGTCNHGRPCWQQINRRDLDRLFRRGQ